MKIQSPWMGRIRGSAGNMTGCKVYDKNIMRAKAFEVNNPNTAAQQVQRGYFADLTKLVASFTPEQLRTLFPSKPKAMSRRNALAKQLAEYNKMAGTEKVIDFAEIDTLGNAPTMDYGNTELEKDSESIGVSIDSTIAQNPLYGDYYYVAILINATKKQIIFPINSTLVSDNDLLISYPKNWEQTDAISAIPLITNSEEGVSEKGFGSFIIKVRPEKKG